MNALHLNLIDNLVDELERIGTIQILSASPYEVMNFLFKQGCGSTSKLLHTMTKYNVTVLVLNLTRQKLSHCISPITLCYSSLRQHGVVRSEEQINLDYFLNFREIWKDVTLQPIGSFVPSLSISIIIQSQNYSSILWGTSRTWRAYYCIPWRR